MLNRNYFVLEIKAVSPIRTVEDLLFVDIS